MRTTININKELILKLKNYSKNLNISTDEIISFLIHIVITKKCFKLTMYRNIKYQNADPVKNWGKLHVNFTPCIYEKGLDLRKIYKLSVSFIVAFAIKHFLDEFIENYTNQEKNIQELDNYQSYYVLIPKSYDGIQGFITIWGYPGEKTLEKLLT